MAGGNQATSVNPPNAEEHLSTNGSDWLWTVFSIMALSTLLAAGATIMVSFFVTRLNKPFTDEVAAEAPWNASLPPTGSHCPHDR